MMEILIFGYGTSVALDKHELSAILCSTLQSTLQLSSSDPQMPQMEAICKIPKIPTIKGSSMTSWQWKHGTLRPKYP